MTPTTTTLDEQQMKLAQGIADALSQNPMGVNEDRFGGLDAMMPCIEFLREQGMDIRVPKQERLEGCSGRWISLRQRP